MSIFNLSQMDISLLRKKYAFELIPDCDAATAAGYTTDERAHAQVYGGPVYDDRFFYYAAYNGSSFSGVFKSSILVCRRKSDGSLIYCANCQDYNLDSGDNISGESKMLCRGTPVITGNKMYLLSGGLSNIGPQLFCVDKRDGSLIYAIAYYLPKIVEDDLGVTYITTPGDYSQYIGSNARIVTYSPGVVKRGHGKDNLIYAGVSSLQNTSGLNPGLFEGGIYYTGYPFHTDQGRLTCIEEISGIPSIRHVTHTCAPDLEVGDILTKVPLGHPNAYRNPFLPQENSVLIKTTIKNAPITQPGIVNGIYFFSQSVVIELGTIISPSLFAPFWDTIGQTIKLDGDITLYTLAEILVIIAASPLGKYTISTTPVSAAGIVGTIALGQLAVYYVKELFEDDDVENIYDANGLGYYGNSVWGSSPTIDECQDIALFGSGQAHSNPLSEQLLFATPGLNYRTLKIPLVDLTNEYVDDPDPVILHDLNIEKKEFESKMRSLSMLNIKSPRGQMSYSSAIIMASLDDGYMLFGIRSIPADVFSFVGADDPIVYGIPIPPDADGDISANVCLHKDRISAVTKSGNTVVFNISNYNGNMWKHMNPSSVGIYVEKYVYTGPDGALGGTNYYESCDSGKIYATNINASYFAGSTGTNGENEKFIDHGGLYVPQSQSPVFRVNPKKGRVDWVAPLLSQASGGNVVECDHVLTGDVGGHLYGLCKHTGEVRWFVNSGTDAEPMLGGIVNPIIDDEYGLVYWLASYDIPAQTPSAGKYGWVLCEDRCLELPCGCSFLKGRTYQSTAGIEGMIHRWGKCDECCECEYRFVARYGEESVKYKVIVDGYDICFELTGCNYRPDILLVSGTLLNNDSYCVQYMDEYNNMSTMYMVVRPC